MEIQTYGPDAIDIIAPHEIHCLGLRPLLHLLNHPGETAQQMEETFVTLNCVEITQRLVSEGFLRFNARRLYPTLGLKIYILKNLDLTPAEREAINNCKTVDLGGYFENDDYEDVF